MKLNFVKAYLLDFIIWFYVFMASNEVMYQKYVLYQRNLSLASGELVAYGLLALVFSVLGHVFNTSVGKALWLNEHYEDNFDKNSVPVRINRNAKRLGWFIFILSFVVGIVLTEVSLREFLSPHGLQGARRIFTALINPNWEILGPSLYAAVETLYMALVATVIALPFAFLLSFAAARNLMSDNRIAFGFYTSIRFVLNVTRAVEPLVWAIIFSVWVGIGPFAGTLALWIHSVSSLAKLYSEQIENIDNGPLEAMMTTGAHPLQVIWFGVVPQVILPFLSFTIYRWDINVRMATVIGLVGGGGIGTMLMQYQGLAKWNEVGLLVIVIAFIVWVMDYLSARIREAIK